MFPTCQVDVFQRAPGSEYHKDEKLDILVRQAAQINLNLRSPAFFFMALPWSS